MSERDLQLLRVRDLARLLDISESAARRLLLTKKIPGRKLGRKWFVSAATLEAWLGGQ